jgi:hypothetical protein
MTLTTVCGQRIDYTLRLGNVRLPGNDDAGSGMGKTGGRSDTDTARAPKNHCYFSFEMIRQLSLLLT